MHRGDKQSLFVHFSLFFELKSDILFICMDNMCATWSHDFKIYCDWPPSICILRLLAVWLGSMIISLSMNITMNQLGGASVIAIFTTRRSHGYVNTTTWLGISQFFLFLAPNFNILTTENRSRCNRDLN